jgi:Flp pilus assembly pilin Flp
VIAPVPKEREKAMADRKMHSSSEQGKDRGRDGQALAEYALILTFIALVCVVGVTLMGGSISGFFTGFGGSF